MAFFAELFGAMWTVIVFLVERFIDWLSLFAMPLYNYDLLWLIIPVYVSWLVTEFFEEKYLTSFGNAVSNGIVPLWASIDWTRYLVNQPAGYAPGELWIKVTLCLLTLFYGITIIYLGISAKEQVRKFGRIREVTYIIIVFTPIIYGIIPLTWNYMFSIIFFFLPFYFFIEWLTKKMPNPYALDKDIETARKGIATETIMPQEEMQQTDNNILAQNTQENTVQQEQAQYEPKHAELEALKENYRTKTPQENQYNSNNQYSDD